MKLIVAGGRDFNDRTNMLACLGRLQDAELISTHPTLVCGMARGADMLAHRIWTQMGLPIDEYPADWNRYGKSAGYRRNVNMGEVADAAAIFWDGESRGTKHMIDIMVRLNKPHWIYRYG